MNGVIPSVAADVYEVFAEKPGGGNPTVVVASADGLSAEQMRSIASRYGVESVFLQTPTVLDAQARLRYFVPNHEMEMCVHATVAAVTWLGEQGVIRPGVVRVETCLGLLSATLGPNGEVEVDQFPPIVADVRPEACQEVAAALGCRVDQILVADTPRSVSVSRAKLLVEMDSLDTLHGLTANVDDVRRVCAALDVTGLYPFASAPDDTSRARRHVWARQFPRDSGYLEDAATGLAAGALAVLLSQREAADGEYRYYVRQGQAMGRPSRMVVRVVRAQGFVDRVAVSGFAHRTSRVQ